MRTRGGAGPYEGREEIFVIHNGQLFPVPQPTRRTVPGIAMRVLDASSRSAVVSDLFRIYAVVQSQQAGFNWLTIPDDVELAGAETFDPVLMQALYDVGYRKAAGGAAWATRPPGLHAP